MLQDPYFQELMRRGLYRDIQRLSSSLEVHDDADGWTLCAKAITGECCRMTLDGNRLRVTGTQEDATYPLCGDSLVMASISVIRCLAKKIPSRK